MSFLDGCCRNAEQGSQQQPLVSFRLPRQGHFTYWLSELDASLHASSQDACLPPSQLFKSLVSTYNNPDLPSHLAGKLFL